MCQNGVQIPERVTNNLANIAATKAYRKALPTLAVGPVTLTRPTVCETKEGEYALASGWEGYFAFDNEGDVYPVAKSVFEQTYEEEN